MAASLARLTTRSAFHFGLFGFFFPLLAVLCLKAHPSACALGHAIGVSPAAFEPQSSCNPHRQVMEGQKGIEVPDFE